LPCNANCTCGLGGPGPGAGPGAGPGPGPGPGGTTGAGGTAGTAGNGGTTGSECPQGSGICGTVYGTQECPGVGSFPRGVWCGNAIIANCCKAQCPYTCPSIRPADPVGQAEPVPLLQDEALLLN
jgi:hypothetical protein